MSLRYKNLLRGIADFELLRILGENGKAEYAEALAEGLLEEKDLAVYQQKSFSTQVGAHTHEWEDFNEMKKRVLEALS